jgi:hypothetical protein
MEAAAMLCIAAIVAYFMGPLDWQALLLGGGLIMLCELVKSLARP